MQEKHPLEELVTKRIRLSPNEASSLVFYLDILSDFYEDLKKRYPKIAKEPSGFHSFIEVDYIDLGRALLWAETMIDRCEKIKTKAHKGKNIIGDSDGYKYLHYSEEDGLFQTDSDGKQYPHWSPIETML